MSSFGGGGKPIVKKNGTVIGQQPAVNLIEGANVTITVADDAANGEVDVTIAAAGGGGSAGIELFEEGVSLGIVTTLNVVGATATAAAVGAAGTLTIGAPALASAAPENVTKAAAAVGVGTTAARVDHKHDITTAAASTLSVGGSNAEGSASSLARSDHTHALPAFGSTGGTFAQGNDSRLSDARTPTAHASTHLSNGSDPIAAATTSVGGLLSAADKTKLDGIATTATNGVTVKDEGSTTGSNQTTFDFVGSGVSVASVGAVTTVTISGGGGGGSGDVVGPSSATDNAVARFDATTGKLIQNSTVTIDDSGNIATSGTVDGRDVSTDGTKLDGIASGATNGITTQDEGAGGGSNQVTLDFVGAGVSASSAGTKTTVTIPGLADGDKGDITVASGGTAWSIDNNAVTTAKIADANVTLPKIANIGTDRLLGRDTAASGAVEELTVGGGVEFTTTGGIQRSALTGDVTASAGSGATTIATAAVTLAKMANLAQDQVIGRVTASTGVPETFIVTSTARAMLDDTSNSAIRTTIGALGGVTGSTDNALLRADGTGGATTQASGIIVSDTDEISGQTANVVSASSGFTTDDTYNGKTVLASHATGFTITLHAAAKKGFNITVIQEGAGQITFAAASGATLFCYGGHTKTAGQYAMVAVIVKSNAGSAAQLNLGGATGA